MLKFPNLLPEDNLEKDQIPGGLADKKKPSDFDPKQIKMGQKVEMEHTNNPAIAREISQDHLTENPQYYTDLKRIEPEHFKKAEENNKTIKLEHYSAQPNLMESGIDPRRHGTGVRGEESKRKSSPDWIDRSYHYIAGTKPEAALATMPHVYASEVPEDKIYDYQKDPLNLKEKSKWGPSLDRNLYEKNIKDAGFHGYVNYGAPGMGHVVALFHPVKPVSKRSKNDGSLNKADDTFRHAKEVLNAHKQGGSTYNLKTGHVGGDLYAVSPFLDRSEVIDGDLNEGHINNFINKNKDLLSKPNHNMGTWKDPETGKNYLDISITTPDKNKAISLANKHNQKAIFHLGTFTTIPTSGTGEKMQKGSAQKRLKFNPEEVSPASRQETEGWTSNYPGYDRPQTPLKGNALARALHKLHATTKTRRNPETGEREFLLYRGKTGRDSVGGLGQLSSFTPHKRHAIDFNRDFVNSLDSDYAKTEIFGDTNHPHSIGSDISSPNRDKYIQDNLAHVYQAWVPESAIHHIPKQIGDTNLFSNLTAPKLTPKKAPFANEHEVIVDTSKIKNITATPRHQIEAEHFKELKLKHGGPQTRLEMKKLNKAVQAPGSQKDQFPKTYEALKLDGDIHNPAVMQHHMKLHEKHAISATSPESAKHHWDNVKKIQAHLSGKLEKGARGDWKKEGYKLEYDHNHDHTNSVVRAVDSVGNEVGRYEFEKHEPSDRNIYIVDSLTHPDHRRKGIATSAYKMAQKNMRGIVYPLEGQQSSEASKLWSQPNRPFGKSFPEVLKKANTILQKARKASPVGTITERHDGKYIKTQDGWEPYNQENAAQAQNYINARQSSFSNVGEDIKGAARHKRTAYTPGDRVTSENNKELINHYSNILSEEMGPHNPLNPFVLKQVLARFPKMKPGVDENVYNNYLSHVTDFVEKNKSNPEIFTTLLNGLKRSLIDKINHDRKQPDYARGSDSFIIKYVNNTISPYGIATGRVTKDLADFTIAAKTASANHTGTTTPTNDQLMGFFHTPEGTKFLKDAMGGKIKKPVSEDGGRQRKLKYAPVDRYVKIAERKGPPVGLDTPQQQVDFLTKAGKIRGLQWGNSVTDPEREHHLKYTAEALKDLMDVTGMPIEMISFNGRLGLAFGARGKGRALAHYEPAEMTINLTRQNGVGSLAHEWGHFLDNVLAKTHNTSTSDEYMYLSEGSQYKMRREESPLTQAMTSLISSDGWGDFYESSKRYLLDLRKQGYSVDSKYWLTPKEMFARAFECHIDHKLSAMGRTNTYLTGVTRGGFWPTEEISAKMAPLFDKFFEEFKKSDHLKKSIDILNKSVLQKAIPEGNYVFYADLDNAGSQVEKAVMSDNVELVSDISGRIALAGRIIANIAKMNGGSVFVSGGDDSAALMPIGTEQVLEKMRKEVSKKTGFTVTIGYGKSSPMAVRALLWGKTHGKNAVIEWSQEKQNEIEKIMKQRTPEEKVAEVFGNE